MQTINKLRKLYQLKHVERFGPVGERKESPAEHTWSAMVLADYFLDQIDARQNQYHYRTQTKYHHESRYNRSHGSW